MQTKKEEEIRQILHVTVPSLDPSTDSHHTLGMQPSQRPDLASRSFLFPLCTLRKRQPLKRLGGATRDDMMHLPAETALTVLISVGPGLKARGLSLDRPARVQGASTARYSLPSMTRTDSGLGLNMMTLKKGRECLWRGDCVSSFPSYFLFCDTEEIKFHLRTPSK